MPEEPLTHDIEDQMIRVMVAAMRAFERGDKPFQQEQKSPAKPVFWAPPGDRDGTTKRQVIEAEITRNPTEANKVMARRIGVSESYIRDIKREIAARAK